MRRTDLKPTLEEYPIKKKSKLRLSKRFSSKRRTTQH
jgi:hypothetical protein